jgi:hypothetical protein
MFNKFNLENPLTFSNKGLKKIPQERLRVKECCVDTFSPMVEAAGRITSYVDIKRCSINPQQYPKTSRFDALTRCTCTTILNYCNGSHTPKIQNRP